MKLCAYHPAVYGEREYCNMLYNPAILHPHTLFSVDNVITVTYNTAACPLLVVAHTEIGGHFCFPNKQSKCNRFQEKLFCSIHLCIMTGFCFSSA